MAATSQSFIQEPIAIIGLACRLPEDCNNPRAFWEFLERGGIASLQPPSTRFRLDTHYSGAKNPKSMASPGGMFLNADPADLDAQFFGLSRQEAVSMDPQQRQLLEVVYEGLENAGVTLENISGKPIGCFISSFACDYADIQARDPEDRPSTSAVGIGRAMLSNRLSHFLNIKGPSMTIDTACSGGLTVIDVACRYLQTREIDGAIIGGCNIYLSPEHVTGNMSFNGYASLSGRCHTFDAKADGYIKAEAANMVMIKRLDEALRDGDPIRGIIRGTATGSDGWTAGIASPNAEAQAETIRQAYANAHISDLNATNYVEFHGTGTKAGDAIEIRSVSSVFAPSLLGSNKLRIGSVKSNIGHSEPAAGLSGLIKVVLAMEKGFIPGNPTFETPNPNIDFESLKVDPRRQSTRWPVVPFRRAGVNSFGYGGSNAHLVVDGAAGVTRHLSSYTEEVDDLFAEDKPLTRPYVVVVSANDQTSLSQYCKSLDSHLSNPAVHIEMRDLAYTLSERRTRHYDRAFAVANHKYLSADTFTFGKRDSQEPRVGYAFTGQGAQWSAMGKYLIETFPVAKQQLVYLDDVLRGLDDAPNWSLLNELSLPCSLAHMRLPEFSQPLVTAFQLAILAVMKDCGLICSTVIGHSSGEIAAATAANYLTPEQAIKIAYYRGKAVSEIIQDQPVGMLAVGIGVNKVLPYLIGVADVEIACKNSPESVTLAGDRKELETLQKRIKSDGHFARLLLVDAAYHSKYMRVIAPRYTEYIEKCCKLSFQDKKSVTMYSSVTGLVLEKEIGQPKYWVDNMTSPVLFQQATQEMLQQEHLDMVVEIGPSDALSGPFKQIMNATSTSVQYASTWKRCEDPLAVFCTLAGNLFLQGAPISLAKFNGDFEGNKPTVLVDLPNYSWNHTTKYWHESDSSKDWRFPNFPHHDLLGSKVLGTPWYQPTWKKAIRLEELPWLRDHMLGENVVFPAAGYVAMATEAVFQMHTSLGNIAPNTQIQQISYRIRDLSIERAMVLEDDGAETKVTLVMNPIAGTKNDWYRFRISSQVNRVINDYCHGSISIMGNVEIVANEADMRPLEHGDPAKYWYKTMQDLGYCYGPGFRTQLAVESRAGQRRSRSIISLTAPKSSIRQSEYPIHPASIDGCFQSVGAPLWQGNRSAVNQALLPAGADEILICAHNPALKSGIAISTAVFEAPGREDDAKSYKANVSLYNDDDGKLLFQMSGLRTHSLQNDGANMVPHTYCRLRWEPDISLLSQAQLNVLLDSSIYSTSSDAKLQDSLLNRVLDLFAFKKPDLKIKEIDMSEKEGNLWIDMRKSEVFDRMRGCQYQYSVMTHDAQSRASIKYGEFGNATIKIMGDTEAFEEEEKFDLIIVSLPPQTAKQSLVIPYILSQLESDGALVMLNRSCNDTKQVLIKGNCFPPSGASKVFPDGLIQEIQNAGFRRSLLIHPNCSAGSSQVRREYALAFAPTDIKVASTETDLVHVLHFLQDWTSTETLCDSLQSNGLKASPHSIPPTGLAQGSIVLVLDELYSPVLSDTNEKQWEALQYLVKLECRILWVTKGCQMQVTDPQRSLFLGLARSICEENPNLVMMTLDVEGLHEEVTASAIGAILKRLKTAVPGECVDKEFVERSNVIHIGRVVPDIVINDTEQGVTVMQEPNSCSLFESQATIRLISSRVGTLDSLLWAESSQIDTCLPDGHVEVEVHAVGINFKDIAVTMGLVPADECKLGLEGAGIIRRLGKDAGNLKVGQRVLINKKGALANKICCEAIGEVFPIPDWLSFEDASTVCIVYSTVFYALLDLANVCEGQSVLIHSGAGGVGLAAIQLCKYLGVTIYATVGTDEKRKFLVEECGIPPTHIFSSRTTEFATSVLKVTNGNGVNCVLNSLSGEGLHESWRCIATGGVFVEIGKKDILENSSLSMGPFVRNASFRAVDMSHDSFDSKFKHKLLERIFELLEKRHIKPIHIGKTFGFENVVDSFRYMRGGLNIGKTVICREPAKNTIVPTRKLARSLIFNDAGAYLIVGGLKGLCGSLAVFLARHGVKHIVLLSRSGYDDSKSRKVLADLSSLGAHVDLVQGDVTLIADVRRTFAHASVPICGIIQGAMVLRDKIYALMTLDEFLAVLRPKVQGTWNLHNVALEREIELDFFTLLSSICGIAGARGQANYSAANVFLDSFASYRQTLGLRANSVSLGVIEDVGYLNEHDDISRRLLAQGWTPIRENLLHRILHYSILQQHPYPLNNVSRAQLITGIPVPLPKQSPVYNDTRFLHLRPMENSTSSECTDMISSSLTIVRSAGKEKSGLVDQAQVLHAIIELSNEKFVRSLGMTEPIDPARSLSSYGIDSLVAVEFRNWARVDLGVDITTLEIVAANTLTSLSETILMRLVKKT